jgi:hypothetical protein
MSDDALRLRKQAEQATEQATKSVSRLDKDAWLRVAEEWLKLAQSVEERRPLANNWLTRHRSGAYVKFTQAGADLFA